MTRRLHPTEEDPVIPRAAGGPYPNHPPDLADQPTRVRARKAAYLAQRVYPGPVGELISRELLAWDQFGFRIVQGGLIERLIDFVLAKHEEAA